MSDTKKSAFGGGRLFGGTNVIAALFAWFTTPAFTGWAGFGKSMLVGAGTSMGATILAIPSAIVGAAAGLLIGAATKKNKTACMMIGGIVAAIPGAVGGMVEGYSLSKEWLIATQPQQPPAAQQTLAAAKPVTAAMSVRMPG